MALDAAVINAILNGTGVAAKEFDPADIEVPAVLDLFCGAGGCTKGYQRSGFYCVGVDIKPQPRYCGEQFVQSDALTFVRENPSLIQKKFVAIHASPPCQGYSTLTPLTHRSNHSTKIVEMTRELLIETGLPYVIENVEGYYTGMVNPIRLCGSMFDLRVRRHRLFECSFPLENAPECKHWWQDEDPIFIIKRGGKWYRTGVVGVYGTGGNKGSDYWPWAMGCGETWDDCWMNMYELTQSIPPAYTEYIGKCLKQELQSSLSLTTN